eukprot:11862913-Heterocapsa_arctica.AAC.1
MAASAGGGEEEASGPHHRHRHHRCRRHAAAAEGPTFCRGRAAAEDPGVADTLRHCRRHRRCRHPW